jgi:hypothetical protein
MLPCEPPEHKLFDHLLEEKRMGQRIPVLGNQKHYNCCSWRMKILFPEKSSVGGWEAASRPVHKHMQHLKNGSIGSRRTAHEKQSEMSNSMPAKTRLESPLDIDTPKYRRQRHSFLKLASIQVPGSPSRDEPMTNQSTIEPGTPSRPKHWGWDSGTPLSRTLPAEGSLASTGSRTAIQDSLQLLNSGKGSMLWDSNVSTDPILHSRKQPTQRKLSMLPPSQHHSLSRRKHLTWFHAHVSLSNRCNFWLKSASRTCSVRQLR